MGLLNNFSSGDIQYRVGELKNSGLSGDALNQAIYKEASSQGVSSSQLESAMGWNAGEVDSWTSANNKNSLSGNSGTTAGTVATYKPLAATATPSSNATASTVSSYSAPTAPAVSPTTTVSPTPTATATQGTMSDSDVRSMLHGMQSGFQSTDDYYQKVYDAATQNGISASQVEKALDLNAGEVDYWTNSKNLQSLGGGNSQSASTPISSYTNTAVPSYTSTSNGFSAGDIQYRVAELKNQGLTGDALNQQIYREAIAQEVTPSQLESALGWNAGEVDRWTNSNDLQALGPTYANTSTWNTSNGFSAGDIQYRIGELQNQGFSGDELFSKIYQEAITQGVTAEQLEAAMGWKAGEVDSWVANNNLDPISQASSYTDSNGNVTTGNTDANYTPTYGEVSADETVQGQLSGLLSAENPLMQSAYYKGLDYANARGVGNSSMAAEGAQAAMINAALGIAQADATTNYDQDKVNQSYDNDWKKSTGLLDLQNEYNREQSTYDTNESIREGGFDVTANTQGAYLDAINDITNNAQTSINFIEVSEGIAQEEKDAMIANTIARRDADLAFYRTLYSNMPTWDMSWVNNETMPAAPGL